MSGGKKETNDEKLISLRRQGQKVWKSKRERKKGICADFGNVPIPFRAFSLMEISMGRTPPIRALLGGS